MSRFQRTAFLISPDRAIAEQLRTTARKAGTFDVVADLQTYPAPETLETRVRQARADVLLIDVATDLETAAALIRQASSLQPQIPVIALHAVNHSTAVLRSLRSGAHEFFHLPFEASVQEAAITRLSRIFEGSGTTERERARLVVFTSAKSGCGVSTLAAETAYALKRGGSSRKILLADFNQQGGSLAFLLGLDQELSMRDLLKPEGRITHELWSQAVVARHGVDVLPGPEFPEPAPPEPARLQPVLEWARSSYDWIVADMPLIFQRTTLVCMAGADHIFLVCTPQLGSLHLTRRAVKLLQQLEFEPSRLQVLVNRMDGKSDLSSSDLTKIFDFRVDRGLPEDRNGIMRRFREDSGCDARSDLGKAVDALADKLTGVQVEKSRTVLKPWPRTANAHV